MGDLILNRMVRGNRLAVAAASAFLAIAAAGVPAASQASALGPLDARDLMTPLQIEALGMVAKLRNLLLDRKGIPTLIEADLGVFRGDTSVRDADSAALLQTLRAVFRSEGSESLHVRRFSRDPDTGMLHYRMDQRIDGREVIGGELILHVVESTSRIASIDAQFLPGTGLPRSPVIGSRPGMDAALAGLTGTAGGKLLTEPRLAFARMPKGDGHLVWVARAGYTDHTGRAQIDDLLVDAIDGRLLRRLPQIHDALSRQIYDYGTRALLIAEGGSTPDIAAQNVYNFAGTTYDFYWNSYGRDSWDAAGTPLIAYVHGTFGGQNNAFSFCPDGHLEFGDGDGLWYGSFTNGLDVVAHEWTHSVTCSEARLALSGEPGALNESMSDVLGAAVEASVTGVTTNTWKLGEAIATPSIPGDAIRYLNDPALDGHSRDYYPDLLPTDEVHDGAGIGNLAFYLLSNGGSHPRGKTSVAVAGIGITKAANINYRALRDKLTSDSGYSAARDATARVATEVYGTGSPEHFSTCRAWNAVGVANSGAFCPVPPPAEVYAYDYLACPYTLVTWTSIPGATYYEAWRSSSATPGQWWLAYSGAGLSVTQGVGRNTTAYFKAKACNTDGCSALSTAGASAVGVQFCP